MKDMEVASNSAMFQFTGSKIGIHSPVLRGRLMVALLMVAKAD